MIFTTLSQVTQLLNGSPIWKDYEQQKHDLFLDNEKPLALTQVGTGLKFCFDFELFVDLLSL